MSQNDMALRRDLRGAKIKRCIFIILMIIVPILNFLIFYCYVNFNSILMAFQNADGSLSFNNFKLVWDQLFNTPQKEMLVYLTNTMYYFLTSVLILLPLTVIIAYFLYKKIWGFRFFRVMFFMPSIISQVILVTLYKNLLIDMGPIAQLFKQIAGLDEYVPISFFTDPKYATSAIIIFCIWTGFGTNLILFTGAMARIPEDVLEASQLDGVSWGREIISIILPLIWPTFTTIVVMAFVGIFTSSGPIHLFTKGGADTTTISYYIFQQTENAAGNKNYAAAVGIFFTMISIPIVFTVKKGMERWQDAIEY